MVVYCGACETAGVHGLWFVLAPLLRMLKGQCMYNLLKLDSVTGLTYMIFFMGFLQFSQHIFIVQQHICIFIYSLTLLCSL